MIWGSPCFRKPPFPHFPLLFQQFDIERSSRIVSATRSLHNFDTGRSRSNETAGRESGGWGRKEKQLIWVCRRIGYTTLTPAFFRPLSSFWGYTQFWDYPHTLYSTHIFYPTLRSQLTSPRLSVPLWRWQKGQGNHTPDFSLGQVYFNTKSVKHGLRKLGPYGWNSMEG